jgi:hypothetical protein
VETKVIHIGASLADSSNYEGSKRLAFGAHQPTIVESHYKVWRNFRESF